ncbi:EFR1 family ferrodoxin [Enterocloster clostridioformis]|uniref:EFR1 family ferrodoxin n=1 Tax=Enterocloster clostridioformis TaxID=1531 RepID=UPI0035225878
MDIINFYHNIRIKKAGLTDMGYQISNSCISCGKCKMICPAKNIEIINGFPSFQHRCQQCMACIQLCPQNALIIRIKRKKGSVTTIPIYQFRI